MHVFEVDYQKTLGSAYVESGLFLFWIKYIGFNFSVSLFFRMHIHFSINSVKLTRPTEKEMTRTAVRGRKDDTCVSRLPSAWPPAATKSFHFTFSLSSIIRLRATSVGERWVMAARVARYVQGHQEGGDEDTFVDVRPASFIVRWLVAAMPDGQPTSDNESRDQPSGPWSTVSVHSSKNFSNSCTEHGHFSPFLFLCAYTAVGIEWAE